MLANAHADCQRSTELTGYIGAWREAHLLALGGNYDAGASAAADRSALRRAVLPAEESTDHGAGGEGGLCARAGGDQTSMASAATSDERRSVVVILVGGFL